jgi:protein O-mannosyl-transferase
MRMIRRLGPASLNSRVLFRLLPAAMLVACVLAAFRPAMTAGFVLFDDHVNFVQNFDYRGLGVHQLSWMFTTRLLGHYIPLSWMSLGLDYLIWGMNPFGYHLTSVLLHALNALLMMVLAGRLLRRVWPLPEHSRAVAGGALAAAIGFAVHPLRAESVAWITERRDVLCGCFVLLVVLLYVAAAEAHCRRRRWLLAGSWLLYAAALLSKAIAVALPVSLWALDATVLGRGSEDRTTRAEIEKLPYLVLAAAAAVTALWAIAPVRALNEDLLLGPRLAAAGFGLTYYLRATLVPVGFPFFIPWPPRVALGQPVFALHAALVAALVALCWTLRRRFPSGLAAFTAYAAWVLPVSGLFQAGPQMAANRYSYLSCTPWALLAGAGVTRLLVGSPRRGAAPPCLSVRRQIVVAIGMTSVTAMLVAATRHQVALWHDPISSSRAEVASAPDNWLPRYHLAVSELQVGQWRAAAVQVRAGLRSTPDAYHLAELGALILATSPDPSARSAGEALGLARRAVDAADPPEAFSLYALAAAQAESGDFAAAETTARAALDEMDEIDVMDEDHETGDPSESPLARSLTAALKLFEQRKPLRLAPVDWL